MTRPAFALSLLSVAFGQSLWAGEVTYSKDIAPLLWKNCVICHRPGEIGPFSLLTYKDAAKRARHLKEVTASHRMPPWKPKPGFGEFMGERRLTADEIALLGRWVDTGAQEGDAADLPAMPKFASGWRLGTPDLIIKAPEMFNVPADGKDIFRYFVIPSGVVEPKMISAVEFHPDCRSAVHHALFYLDNTGQARELASAGTGLSYGGFSNAMGLQPSGSLGGWIAGTNPRRFPPDTGMSMRKNSDIILQVHYHPDGKPERDQSSLGIYFNRNPSAQAILRLYVIGTPRINIPPGEKRYRVTGNFTLPAGAKAIGIAPHMHYLGREMKAMAILPDGKSVPLVWIDDWDFNWQGVYHYRRPIPLPAGTKIEMEAYFDNSTDNLQNPNNPPKRVVQGSNSTNEMCNCQLLLIPDDADARAAIARQIAQKSKDRKEKKDAPPAKSE
jgi:hypothetical protein